MYTPPQDNRYPHGMYHHTHSDNRYAEYIAEQIKKGTTTCALTCKDGVVLAADTRASAGFFIADRHVMRFRKSIDI
jgi:proteasome beta subunit